MPTQTRTALTRTALTRTALTRTARARTALFGGLTAALLATAAGAAPHSIAETIDAAIGDTAFNTLHAAVEAAGLLDALDADGPFTLFAPGDAAFAALPEAERARLLDPANRAALAEVLRRHVVPGALTAAALAGHDGPLASLDGVALPVDAAEEMRIAGATVIAADIPASNGVVHVIDRVILAD